MPIFPSYSRDDSLYAAAHAYAIELRNGVNSGVALQRIGDRYRNLSSADIGTAQQIGQAYRDAAIAYTSGVARMATGVVAASVDPTQPRQFRYVTVTEFQRPDMAKSTYRNIVIESDTPLSQRELAVQVLDELTTGQGLGQASLPGGSGSDGVSTMTVNVASFSTQS